MSTLSFVISTVLPATASSRTEPSRRLAISRARKPLDRLGRGLHVLAELLAEDAEVGLGRVLDELLLVVAEDDALDVELVAEDLLHLHEHRALRRVARDEVDGREGLADLEVVLHAEGAAHRDRVPHRGHLALELLVAQRGLVSRPVAEVHGLGLSLGRARLRQISSVMKGMKGAATVTSRQSTRRSTA